MPPGEGTDGFLHRIERVGGGRQQRKLDQLVECFGQGFGAAIVKHRRPDGQFDHPHPVLRQGTGLVHGQHGDGAQRLYGLQPAREHLLA